VIHSCQESEDSILKRGPDDPVSKMMRTIFGAFAQYERAMIEIRMATGMRHKAARGGYTGGGKPFGYKIVDGDLCIDPVESKIVKYIYFLKFQLGASLRSISAQLEHELGMKFAHTKVRRILKSESLYRGYYKDRFDEIHLRDDLIILDQEGYDYSTLFGEGTHHANPTTN
jgi:DNA invertase Pin-like site-specific DNA recombinase